MPSIDQRMQDIRPLLLPGKTDVERKENRRILLENRKGDYLLKTTNNTFGEVKYIQYNYGLTKGWHMLGPRRSAAWFQREELPELLKTFKKGYKLVKR